MKKCECGGKFVVVKQWEILTKHRTITLTQLKCDKCKKVTLGKKEVKNPNDQILDG